MLAAFSQLRAAVGKWFAAPVSATSEARGGWWGIIRESFSGAWQRNTELAVEDALSTPIIYSCFTLIANDFGKLRQRLVEQDSDGIWNEVKSPSPYWPVLRRPNRYQNQVQFKQWWIMSKLRSGNTYGLKQRDQRGIVTAIYILDPRRVLPLISDDGSIYYQLSQDNLSGIAQAGVIVPASEIIHDRMNCLYHPLVGVSPLYAAAIAAGIGIAITGNVLRFHKNGSLPGGIITAPGNIDETDAVALAAKWQTGFTGDNAGKVAVLADGLKYEPMSQNAVDSQLIETLKWSDERVCSVMHVPAYKVGVGSPPAQTNIEALQQQYYSDCLHIFVEEYEHVFDDGFGLSAVPINGRTIGVDLDIDGLLRMDSKTLIETVGAGVEKAIMKTDEARRRLNLGKVPGGDTIWRQQQYYSLAALDERDKNDPFAKPPAPAPQSESPSELEIDQSNTAKMIATFDEAFAS